jgi:predicted CXXCH cytochrome family protein
MNIPSLCGSCHKEGTEVSQLRTVSEDHVLEDYSQSIHGDGLFKRGLIVTAVCSSCHTSHDILPHENPESTINRNKIATTCMQCHAQIEQVHLKVIQGELWEKEPHQIPICIDCHQPHNVRRVLYEESFPDSEESFPDSMCMSCHRDQDLHTVVDGEEISLYVEEEEVRYSAHRASSCIKCHANVSASRKPVCRGSGKVDCSMCHPVQGEDYQVSQHGKYHAEGNPIAPYCTDCHGTHATQAKTDIDSPIFARNIPDLCGRCHREGQSAAVTYTGDEHEIIERYKMSIHGKGLLQSGLMVTATCVNCHTSHRELPANDLESTVSDANIAGTCANCHLGIYEDFKNSSHSPTVTKTTEDLPTCKDCHLSHTIKRVDQDDFRQEIQDQCGKCHVEVTETYFETFHGKVSKLGSIRTARCNDCHGSHNILPVSNPQSTLSRANVVETCKSCHPNSNRQFVGYLTHATHHNKSKYPYLYYTFWFMTFLLLGTFSFFGAHTVLWLPRAIRERRNVVTEKEAPSVPELHVDHKEAHYERFDAFSRFLHLLVIISFLSLAITGMTIKFSGVGVFQMLSRILGGYEVTGFIHRVAAVITFLYFGLHVGYLIRKKRRREMSFRDMLAGENTLMFRKKDLVDFYQTVKWFLGLGPRPEYSRWTYWEKFDYFAVFWGVTIIGCSGLLLWFPEFFTNWFNVPGWLINVATIIHSDEALLATGFIFSVHFFNTHFRPDKFPMDPVIFTGRVHLSELKQDRPQEFESILKSRRLRKRLGLTCLSIGILIIVLIIYSMIFLYQ